MICSPGPAGRPESAHEAFRIMTSIDRDGLPEPSAQAQAASAALAQRIVERIDEAGGWIGFDRYMQDALYEPGLGYYSAPNPIFAEETGAGDFVTAPQMSALFGRCIAVQCAQWLEQVGGSIVEFGAGTGALAAQLLAAFDRTSVGPAEYVIVELSASLRERQRRTIAAAVPQWLDRVRWLDRLPESIEGVIVANEVLDAMPVRIFRRTDTQIGELGVVHDAGRFEWAERPADAEFAARVQERLHAAWTRYGHAGGDTPQTPEGQVQASGSAYVSELGEQAEAWVASVGSRLVRGAMLLIDYGFPRHEFYHPQRATGTLRCHYRHRAHDDPFRWPGLQDITAHVDFTAIAAAGRDAGLNLLGYASQARFLLDCGLLDAALSVPRDDPVRWTRETAAVQRLLSEAEMGELFKVIALGRGLEDDAVGFRSRDRRAALRIDAGKSTGPDLPGSGRC